MNTTIFETAKALQNAGFPQPEPAPGQFWYNQKGLLHVVFIEGGEGRCFLSIADGDAWPCVDEGYIFAPQAHDILAQLAKDIYPNLIRVDISSYNSEFPKQVQAPQFCIYSLPDNQLSVLQFEFQTNPHEVAAKSYLQLHKPA